MLSSERYTGIDWEFYEDLPSENFVPIRRKKTTRKSLRQNHKLRRKEAERKAREIRSEQLERLEKVQFESVLGKIDKELATDGEMKFALSAANKFMGMLPDEEFNERFLRIWKREYTNSDILRVAAHFSSVGNPLAGSAISELAYSFEVGKPESDILQIPKGAYDAVDLAVRFPRF